ncbi:MAG: 3-hydroxyacyl-CoA dehydrogenase [Micromonosporaceae bacterium]|nr:3-hydroxyacyl-CoA dehydrogenase [Micromonosporaceae bacterium]
MSEKNMFGWEQGADGVVVLTMDDPDQSANTMNERFASSFAAIVDRLEAEKDDIAGVVITSAKKTFFAGGDLNLMIKAERKDAPKIAEFVDGVKATMRRLETLGKPVVAAVNGSALGGGLEIALACHRRIALDARGIEIGTPEATLGLLPGAGGVTRTVRMLGIADALLKVLLQGQRHKPAQALEVGLVDELVAAADELIGKAKAWIAANPEAAQPWDRPGHKIPGGTPSNPKFAANLPAFPANLRKQTKGANFPAQRDILAAAVEGSQVDFDTASKIETRYLVDLVTGRVAKNMIKAFFFDLQAINKGGSRPDGYPQRLVTKVAVLGAGMMGAGIAYVSARNGIDVILKDVNLEGAAKGKAYSQKLLEKAVSRGKLTQDKADEILGRITATDSVEDCAGADLVVEAVFEDPDLKQRVFAETEKVLAPDALLGSNTSTLPITDLATGVTRPEDFIGLHFFSPVDKMPLLEIIVGEQTSDEALARAVDYAQQIKKTPIVVNDSRGFFTSRVIGAFVLEAIAMLAEGVPAPSIEQACTQAGYPVGALALTDEISLTLWEKIHQQTKTAAEAEGRAFTEHPAAPVVTKMIHEYDRKGRAAGAGFYEYADGKKAGLWPGLAEAFGAASGPPAISMTEMQERMLFIEAIETARCFDEGVLRTVADANIGSIFGIGYPAWTGGVIQYINQYSGGVAGFVARARELAAGYGERFTPPASLVAKAEKGEIFE